ncbi:SRR1-like protein isoform X3 [Meriones unguiculatus]|uniref:SRR1-like protein isoform X3 n=1 Tax=Meriones unguiculatus TaxID=10047 RepID=UPI00293F5287|nr:SRR1-like protein isoform X3 [Meriones unguiculatus]
MCSDHNWGNGLSETVAECLRKQLEQLQALTEAFGRLRLDLSPEGSEEPLATSTFPVKCVCYGLGNFASCVTARTQLAFMLLFLEKCQIPRSHCWAYDPLFSQTEVSVLSSLGVTVLSENEEGKCSVQGQPTVFYMPHCGTALYNNLLWSNWSADALSRVLIIGNSFQGLQERLLTRILQENYPYVAKVSDKIAGWGCKAIVSAHVNEHTYWEGAPLEPAGAKPFHPQGEPAFPLPLGLKSIEIQTSISYFSKGKWGVQVNRKVSQESGVIPNACVWTSLLRF